MNKKLFITFITVLITCIMLITSCSDTMTLTETYTNGEEQNVKTTIIGRGSAGFDYTFTYYDIVDPVTGVHYLGWRGSDSSSGMTPRLNSDGTIMTD